MAGVGSDSTPAAALESVLTTFTYYVGNDTTGRPGQRGPTATGTYTVVSHFAGSADYTSADSQPMTFTIAPATLTVTADAETKVYGQSDPAFTYEVERLQPGDHGVDVLSGALGRVAGETVDGGPYAISQGTLACNNNYTIAFAGNDPDDHPGHADGDRRGRDQGLRAERPGAGLPGNRLPVQRQRGRRFLRAA